MLYQGVANVGKTEFDGLITLLGKESTAIKVGTNTGTA